MSSMLAFTGGGTGGHIFPGIAVIEKLKAIEPSLQFLWIGSGSRLDQEIVARFGIPFERIPSGKMRRYFSLRNVFDIFKIIGGFTVSFLLLSRRRPVLLFSKGGYVSVPPVIAARLLRIPVFTHESDVDPGLATRINARFAERIFVAYDESRGYFPGARRDSVVVSGNPVRGEISEGDARRGRRFVGAPDGKAILLVLGGSQGARQLNRLVSDALDRLLEDYFVIHQMGEAEYRAAGRAGYYATAFLSAEYADVLAAANVVLCRSGAGTLWELAATGKPSILVPLESYSRGDQLKNAQQFARRGAAVVLHGDGASAERLVESARRLARNPAELTAMAAAARDIYLGDAAGTIADAIVTRIRNEYGDCTA